MLLHRVREQGTSLHWVWVKGHCGHIANERADQLATTGMFKPGWRRYRAIPRSYLTANRRYVLAEDEERRWSWRCLEVGHAAVLPSPA